MPLAVVALAFALAAPNIAVGFYADDRLLLAVLDHRWPMHPAWWDLYRLIPSGEHAEQLAHGVIPWWAAPHLHIRFVRPLASAFVTLDHAVFGDSPLGYHLDSLAWWAGLLAISRAAFSRWLPAPSSTLALATFAFSAAHTYPVGWVSARHELMATAFVAGGLALLTDSEGDRQRRRLAALAAFVLGLAASEEAIGGLAFALMHDLVGPTAAARAWSARLRRGAVWAVTAVVYVAFYASLGGGARESGGYFSPLSSPGRFLEAGIVRYPVFLANALLGVPAEFAVLGASAALAVAGLLAAAGTVAMWRASTRWIEPTERDAIRWLVPGALLSIVPCLGAFPGARVLEVADLGFAALIAVVVRHAFARGPWATARRSAGGLLIALHLVLAPLAGLASLAATVRGRRQTDAVAEDAAKAIGGAERDFLLAASDPMVSVYAPLTLAAQGRGHGCWTWLSGAKTDVRVTRTSTRSLLIEPLGLTLMHGPFETLYRDPLIPFQEGEEATVCGARITVARLEDHLPAAIELHLEDMDDPRVALLVWRAGALQRLTAPDVGASVVVPWSEGPSGAF
jgi:hypothetical protein